MNNRLFALLAAAALAACGPDAPHSLTGTIADASMHTLTVRDAEGQTYEFSTVDADLTQANGLLLGAPVTVEYKGRLQKEMQAAAVATDPTYFEAVGRWTRPDPLEAEAVMGIEIDIEGAAQSINMATLLYTGWELRADPHKILLRGKSLGNGRTIDFTQTATLAPDPDGKLTLRIDGTDTVYEKQ